MHMWAGWSTAALIRALVRLMLLAGASVAGFLLFSLLAGPAHADPPGDGPALTGPELDLDGLLDLGPLPDPPDLPEPGPEPEPEPEPEPRPEPAPREPEPAPESAAVPAPKPVPETAPEAEADPGPETGSKPAPEPEAAAEPAGLVSPVAGAVDAVVAAAAEEEIVPLPAGEVLPVLEPVTEPVDQLLVLVGDTVETTVSSLEPVVQQVVPADPLADVVSMVLDMPEIAYPSDLPAAPATMAFTAEPVSDRSAAQAVPLPPRTGPPAGFAADLAGSTDPATAGSAPGPQNGSTGRLAAGPAPGGGVCHLDGAANDTGPPAPDTTPCTSRIPPSAGELRIPDQLSGAGLAFPISPLPG